MAREESARVIEVSLECKWGNKMDFLFLEKVDETGVAGCAAALSARAYAGFGLQPRAAMSYMVLNQNRGF
jgi:hypothetical protein